MVKKKKSKTVKGIAMNSIRLRIQRVADLVLESDGMKPMGQAMIEAGYPQSTSKNPQRLVRAKAWSEIMNERLGEDSLAKVHEKLLKAKMPVLLEHSFGPDVPDDVIQVLIESVADCHLISIRNIEVPKKNGEMKVFRLAYYSAPDNATRRVVLDTAYKLRGSYAAEKHVVGHFRLSDIRRKLNEMDNR